MSQNRLEMVLGSDNPFTEAALPDADTELMKADLATAIVRILREGDLAATLPKLPAFAFGRTTKGKRMRKQAHTEPIRGRRMWPILDLTIHYRCA